MTLESGFTATAAALGGCCVFAMVTGLLLAEVQVAVVARHGSPAATLPTMAAKTLGPAGEAAATAIYLFHSYALLVAYTARAGQIVSNAAHLPGLTSAAAFSLTFGGLCFAASPSQFERINGVLLGAAFLTFLALLGVAGPQVDLPVLGRAEWAAVPPTLPVLALAFVYHNVVPLVVHNLECDTGKIRTAIITGTLIPAAMYLVWDAAILGSLDNLAANAAAAAAATAAASAAVAASAAAVTAEAAAASADAAASGADAAASAGAVSLAAAEAATAAAAAAAATADASAAAAAAASGGAIADVAAAAAAAATAAGSSAAEVTAALDPLALLQRSGGPEVASLVQVFAFMAVATSYTGFILAAVDFLPDAFKPLASMPRAGRYALVVLPPTLLSTASPGLFFAALEFAGTYGVMTLYGMMPAAMAWASRYGPQAAAVPGAGTEELVPGGRAALLLTGAAAAAVIVSQWV